MNDLVPVPRDTVSRRFHFGVFKVLGALGLWFVAMAWSFCGGGRGGLILGIVTYVFGLSLLIPAALAWMRQARRTAEPGEEEGLSFAAWLRREVETATGRVRGLTAAIELAVPIAAVAVGMTALTIVLHSVVSHVNAY
jgi:hypothetical protein